MKKVSKYSLCVLLVLLFAGGVMYAGDYVMFRSLHWFRREPERANEIAEKIKNRPVCVALALNDINCFGGSNRGQSSWLLCNTTNDTVEPKLIRIATNAKADMSKRIESYSILWRRTNDAAYLLDLFRLLQPAVPGSMLVHRGRNELGMLIGRARVAESGVENVEERIAISNMFDIDSAHALPMTTNEIAAIINGAPFLENVQ